jgi:hypothetical protein
VVVVSYNMERELPRTLYTLCPPYQAGIARDDLEVIVVDNGSKVLPSLGGAPEDVRLLQVDRPTHSPVAAVNLGLRAARADLIGVLIDGARMASPGLLRYALLATRLHERPIVSTLGFHLGPEVQMKSVAKGYCQEEEDRLLATIDWREDGYRLFEVSVFAGSSGHGWFMPLSESNALFLPRTLWSELGGYDERFATPGGGFANLDTYVRACALPDTELITLLGEGTFHQVHGGIATNQGGPSPHVDAFRAEYAEITGKVFAPPRRAPLFLGTLPPQATASIRFSANKLAV